MAAVALLTLRINIIYHCIHYGYLTSWGDGNWGKIAKVRVLVIPLSGHPYFSSGYLPKSYMWKMNPFTSVPSGQNTYLDLLYPSETSYVRKSTHFGFNRHETQFLFLSTSSAMSALSAVYLEKTFPWVCFTLQAVCWGSGEQQSRGNPHHCTLIGSAH